VYPNARFRGQNPRTPVHNRRSSRPGHHQWAAGRGGARGCTDLGVESDVESDGGFRKVMVMRVFVAGGTGVLGRRLVPRLVATR
jgi:hypothetical protein